MIAGLLFLVGAVILGGLVIVLAARADARGDLDLGELDAWEAHVEAMRAARGVEPLPGNVRPIHDTTPKGEHA